MATAALDIAPIAVMYGRQSQGSQASIDQQNNAGVRVCDEEGWTLGATYSDPTSASRFATKAREEWGRLLADMDAGKFGILILWESSRGDRRLSTWAAMLELARDRGVKIYVITHERLYDLRIARDWKALAEDGTDSAYESEKTSLRVRRDMATHAAEGRPTGRVPVGYVRRYDLIQEPSGKTKRVFTQLPDDSPAGIAESHRFAEANGTEPPTPLAPMIRDLFARIAAGHSLMAIARDFDTQGYRTRKGTPYTSAHLRTLARMHCYTALRVHQPGHRSRTASSGYHGKDGVTVYEGTWEPLVSRELFWNVQDILEDPSRRKHRPGRANHLLSMIALCHHCGGQLTVRFSRRKDGSETPVYICRKGGHVWINEAELDEVAEGDMLDYLRHQGFAETLKERADDDNELQRVRGEIAELDHRLRELANDTSLSERVLSLRAAALERDLEAAQARERTLATPPRLRGLITPGPGVDAEWKIMPMSTKREVARILLAPDMLGEMRVTRSPLPGGQWVAAAERIVMRKDDAA